MMHLPLPRYFLPTVGWLAAAILHPLESPGSETPSATGPGTPLGVEVIEGPLPILDPSGLRFRHPNQEDEFPPVRLLLSKSRYWVEDGHLDAVVRLHGATLDGSLLTAAILDAQDNELALYEFDPPPGEAFIFFPPLPDALDGGSEGRLRLRWTHDESVTAEVTEVFRVESFPMNVPEIGTIPIKAPNPGGVRQKGVPFTLGVPFPRGLIQSTSQLQLLDENGAVVPSQIEARARWSKFGFVKWVLLDFTADLDGEPRTFQLAYGPESDERQTEPLQLEVVPGQFPEFSTDVFRFDDGLWFDTDGDGEFEKIFDGPALAGAYLEHEDGRRFRPEAETPFTVKEDGPEKIILEREGWYREENGETRFCRYITRYVVHRGSPLIRVFHTWIFTGDGNRDRIANMGWEFPFAEPPGRRGFLSAFGPEGEWLEGDYLVQYSPNAFLVQKDAVREEFEEGRAPGAAWAVVGNTNVFFGTKDFWQNYPSELEFDGDSFWFHNWPRHNPPATYSYDTEALPEEEWTRNAIQLLFAHQGEVLDFRLPDEFAEEPIRMEVSRGNEGASSHWDWHQPESANAQGISRTEEFWIYLTPEAKPVEESETVLTALNNETLRAFVDPHWMADSGAFYALHPQDWENYPAEEHAFALTARTPALWQDRLGAYGMWIYGDVPTWGLNLGNRTASLYRTYRSRHHGWPYSWLPYIRSGDPELLKYADAATRQVVDAAYCHYVSPDVERLAGEDRARRIGIWARSLVPWTGRYHPSSRCYESKVDYLLHAYYLTGYQRAWDLMESWMEQTKIEDTLSRRGIMSAGGHPSPRNHVTMLKSCVDVWEATYDPWFLVAAHVFAEGHREAFALGRFSGHFWVPAARDFHLFTGDDRMIDYYLGYADTWGAPEMASWAATGGPMIESNAYAWELTGDDYYLRRVENFLDYPAKAVFDGPGPDYLQGLYLRGSSHMIFTGWYLSLFPTALATVHAAGEGRETVPNVVSLGTGRDLRPGTRLPFGLPIIKTLKTEPDQPLPLRLAASSRTGDVEAHIVITGPDDSIIHEGPL